MCFSELCEDGNEEFTVCSGRIHSYIAILAYQAFELVIILISIGSIMLSKNFLIEDDWYNELFVPVIFFSALSITYPLGPLGTLLENTELISYYQLRETLAALWALIWIGYSLIIQGGVLGVVLALVCFIWAAYFFTGLYFSFQLQTYLKERYMGYDDADPDFERVLEFEAEIESTDVSVEKLDGTRPTTTTPTTTETRGNSTDKDKFSTPTTSSPNEKVAKGIKTPMEPSSNNKSSEEGTNSKENLRGNEKKIKITDPQSKSSEEKGKGNNKEKNDLKANFTPAAVQKKSPDKPSKDKQVANKNSKEKVPEKRPKGPPKAVEGPNKDKKGSEEKKPTAAVQTKQKAADVKKKK